MFSSRLMAVAVTAGLVFVPQLGLSAGPASFGAWTIGQNEPSDEPVKPRKRRRRRKRRKKTRKTRAAAPVQKQAPEPSTTESEASALRASDRAQADADRAKRVMEGRQGSRVTEGTPSRWSNRGAMIPVASEVPLTAPLPTRAVPRPAGVPTVGQRLQGREGLLSARLSASYYRLALLGDVGNLGQDGGLPDALDLMRLRTTVGYQRIEGTRFGLQVDGEFRPRLSGGVDQPTDGRLNEAYVSWGRTDWRRRRTGPAWGVAAGRVSIREAGFAQADGLAVRARIDPRLMVGAWGGVTGNPYGYNWVNGFADSFGVDNYTGGALVSTLFERMSFSLSGGLTGNAAGLERFFVYGDGIWAVTDDLNLLVNGWVDTIAEGVEVTNVDVIAAYTPSRDLSIMVAGGRFATVVYTNNELGTFLFDPNGNTIGVSPEDQAPDPNSQIVGVDGDPAQNVFSVLRTQYNTVRARVGYRLRPFEVYGRWNTLFRDNDDERVDFASVRSLPTAGVRFNHRRWFEADTAYTYVIDGQSTATHILRARLGRGWRGLYGSASVRGFLGDVNGYDVGADISYTLPRRWTPGAFTLRASVRYFRDDQEFFDPTLLDPNNNDPVDERGVLVSLQESLSGFAAIEWRY